NSSNEAALERFLTCDLRFSDIETSCEQVLKSHQYEPHPSLDKLFELDHWAREEIKRWKSC
ncbi:MAG: 1-deoxy-D-xylulose-5-phosphate reductoisomerase, partial [Gimesia chilikensis]